MRDATLRFGLGLGLISAACGIFALLLGAFFFSIPEDATADSVAVAILIRGILALAALGVSLGLAYYAGMRVERDRVRNLLDTSSPQDRIGSLIAGLLVSFCWWFGTTLTGYLLPLLPQAASSAANTSELAERLVWGALISIIGAGLGGLGARMVAARAVLDRAIVGGPTPSASLVAAGMPSPLGAPTSASTATASVPGSESGEVTPEVNRETATE